MKRNLLYLLFAFCLISFGANAQNPTVVSITGEAVGGWGDGHDFDMTSSDGENWSINITTAAANSPLGDNAGGIKFRANHAWDINWGSDDVPNFPDGTGVQGKKNIQCTAGNWDVTFNSTTGEYHFIAGAPIDVVKLVGTATSADVNFSTLDGTNYAATNVTLLNGTAQFSINGLLFGATAFPIGATDGPNASTDMIPVPAGVYSSISYNIGDGSYTFVAAPVYPLISITGLAVGGWGDGFDFDMTTTDGVTYTYENLTVAAVDGLKFRVNHDWAVSYGGGTFPGGNTSAGGNIIPDVAGIYNVTFNLTTGDYLFSFPKIAIVGDGTIQGWPSDTSIDENAMATTDGTNYTLSGITLLDGFHIKFREDNNWTVSWGGDTDPATFPAGHGVTSGAHDIPTLGGVYDVTFSRATGDYNFASLATNSFAANSNFKVYPNPSQNSWNFSSAKGAINTIQIVDVLGKTILTVAPNNTNAIIDASALNAGIYFAKVGTAAATQTIKVVRN